MPFSARFLAGDPVATAFLPDGFRRASERSTAVRRAAGRTVAPALVAALAQQAERYELREAQRRNLDALDGGGAAAVVVGQQVGLHLGPLYTVHKAAAAIATARALADETGTPCIPIFWLQTEDHDLEEIRSVTVPTERGPLRLDVPDDGRERVAVRHRRLPDAVAGVADAVESALDGLPRAAETVAWLRRHWRPGAAWHEAFAGALTELFGDDGLVLIDPRDPAVAALSAPILLRALDGGDEIARGLGARAEALRAADLVPQVHVRERAPLIFFHPDGPDGPRYRLEPDGAAWTTVGGGRRFSREDVRARAGAEPLVLSTSALLRPLVQDTLLPTALTLGGPGELAYFAQIPPLYEHFELPMPLVGPRAHLRLVDDRAARLLGRLGIAPIDTETSRDVLLARLTARREDDLPPAELARADLTRCADQVVDRFAARVLGLGGTLDDAFDRTKRTLAHALGKLADRYERALAEHDEVALRRTDRLLALLQPGGVPQERVHGVAWWAARCGLRPLAERLVSACVPFDGTMRDVDVSTATEDR